MVVGGRCDVEALGVVFCRSFWDVEVQRQWCNIIFGLSRRLQIVDKKRVAGPKRGVKQLVSAKNNLAYLRCT